MRRTCRLVYAGVCVCGDAEPFRESENIDIVYVHKMG